MDVSWLIPVRDGAQWLGAAVRSALDECELTDEVVVVDDGSRDDPGSVLPDDGRIVLLRQPPLGISQALEHGRARARGELIARLDADDVAVAGRIGAQRPLFDDPRVAVVGGLASMVRDDGPVPEGMRRYLDWVNGVLDPHAELLVESPLFHPSVTFRARAVEQVGGYRHDDLPEDYDLWLRLASAGWRLAKVSRDVVVLRDRSDRLTRTHARYTRDAFRRARMAFLRRGPLSEPRRVVVWGAGKGGRPWIRWLLSQGHRVPAVIDPFGAPSRQGVDVLPPSSLPSLSFDLLLVAVGARGARDLIRQELVRVRPDIEEGRDWWAVA